MRNKVTEPFIEEIEKAAKDIISKKEIQSIDYEGYELYLTNGNRIFFEDQYFERRRQMNTIALYLLLNKDSQCNKHSQCNKDIQSNKEMIEYLENIIWQVCGEYTWALPPHLTIKKNKFDKDARYCIDLFAAETAQTLAEFAEFFCDILSETIKDRISIEIENRIFEPLNGQKWDWEYKENNWSAVIGGSIGMAALSLYKESPEIIKKILKRLETSFSSFFKSFTDCGACIEGISYWGYGFGYYCYFAEKYKTVFGSDIYI